MDIVLIYIYPANRMEDLLVLFDKVQQSSSIPVLAKEIVLVQNPGMQHWLNMQQAEISGISMNASFVLPAQFLWQQLRLLSGDDVPEQAPYSREVLAWRIDALLQSDAVLQHEDCQLANQYWQANQSKDPLKRFQLAVQLADLYEQYLIYRPKWIQLWGQGEKASDFDENAKQQESWQAYIWNCLHQQIPYDPCKLIEQAKQNLPQFKHLLPQRISIFGINALAPMWVDFLSLISDVVDVHFYHLNPCYEFWGDIKTDKQQAKQAYLQQTHKWPQDPVEDSVSNPILANLGQQGREFLNLLHQVENIEIPLFDELYSQENAHSHNKADKVSVLKQLQKDILTLTDNRLTPNTAIDNSITITSAHSALREVQGLHDYLLHLFNNDPTLTPKDVLVMCPQIEQYAPYIDSVFVRGWEDIGESIPPLPCSIADRVSKDSEPLVAAFSEILNLPDSRFGVNQILAYLRLLPLQQRFDLDEADVELVSDWLLKANVHWGLDAKHKDQILHSQGSNSQFTWEQGLNRLLMGFAYGDESSVVDNDLMLEWIEGSHAIILGKLMLVCEQLKQMSIEFKTAKTASQWQVSLQQHLQALFVEVEYDNGLEIITQAIDSLALYCEEAKYHGAIELDVVREYLNHHFSQPDPGRQFMIGQITFCSMLPMRSIPFKVLAVLGLNDGEFPRQRQPLGFDLMSMTKPIPGDRSRRGDDRYLFLEALISARDNLYLSYQGNDIRNNNERQPSIVLRELMDYLSNAYQWQFSCKAPPQVSQLRRLPLQVFSLDNFLSGNALQSFDDKWLTLAQNKEPAVASNITVLEDDPNQGFDVSLKQLQRFLTNPAQNFAQQRLKLFFQQQNQQLEDAEPFNINSLDKYLYQADVLNQEYNEQNLQSEINKSEIFAKALLSGDFPDNPQTPTQLSQWQSVMGNFSQAIKHKVALATGALDDDAESQITDVDMVFNLVGNKRQPWNLNNTLECTADQRQAVLFQYRGAKAKAKDITWLYLSHLFTCAHQQDLENKRTVQSFGYFLNEKDSTLQQLSFAHIEGAKTILSTLLGYFHCGQNQALLLNSQLAEKIFWKVSKSKAKGKASASQSNYFIADEFLQRDFEKFWQDQNNFNRLDDDPYVSYFWPQCPDISQYITALQDVYEPMFKELQWVEFDLESMQLGTTNMIRSNTKNSPVAKSPTMKKQDANSQVSK